MSDEQAARIRELEERLHERDLAVAALSQQLADRNAAWDLTIFEEPFNLLIECVRERDERLRKRDAAWERAIQSLAEQGVIMLDDPIAAVRERLESEGGGA